MDNLFVKSIVSERIKLKPHELRRGYEDTILKRIRDTHEARCTRNGYVRRGSVELFKLSEGRLDNNSLNGSVQLVALFSCEACNPVRGDIVTATVRNFNRFGVMATVGIADANSTKKKPTVLPILSIVVPKQSASGAMQSAVDLENITVGDKLVTEIVGVKYELNDPRISVLGRAIEHITVQKETVNVDVPDEDDLTETPVDGNSEQQQSKEQSQQQVLRQSSPDISMRKVQRDADAAAANNEQQPFEGDEEDPEEDAEMSVAAALAADSSAANKDDDEDEGREDNSEEEDEFQDEDGEEDDDDDDFEDGDDDDIDDGDDDDEAKSDTSASTSVPNKQRGSKKDQNKAQPRTKSGPSGTATGSAGARTSSPTVLTNAKPKATRSKKAENKDPTATIRKPKINTDQNKDASSSSVKIN